MRSVNYLVAFAAALFMVIVNIGCVKKTNDDQFAQYYDWRFTNDSGSARHELLLHYIGNIDSDIARSCLLDNIADDDNSDLTRSYAIYALGTQVRNDYLTQEEYRDYIRRGFRSYCRSLDDLFEYFYTAGSLNRLEAQSLFLLLDPDKWDRHEKSFFNMYAGKFLHQLSGYEASVLSLPISDSTDVLSKFTDWVLDKEIEEKDDVIAEILTLARNNSIPLAEDVIELLIEDATGSSYADDDICDIIRVAAFSCDFNNNRLTKLIEKIARFSTDLEIRDVAQAYLNITSGTFSFDDVMSLGTIDLKVDSIKLNKLCTAEEVIDEHQDVLEELVNHSRDPWSGKVSRPLLDVLIDNAGDEEEAIEHDETEKTRVAGGQEELLRDITWIAESDLSYYNDYQKQRLESAIDGMIELVGSSNEKIDDWFRSIIESESSASMVKSIAYMHIAANPRLEDLDILGSWLLYTDSKDVAENIIDALVSLDSYESKPYLLEAYDLLARDDLPCVALSNFKTGDKYMDLFSNYTEKKQRAEGVIRDQLLAAIDLAENRSETYEYVVAKFDASLDTESSWDYIDTERYYDFWLWFVRSTTEEGKDLVDPQVLIKKAKKAISS